MDQTLIALFKDKHELLGGSEAKIKFIVRLTVTKEGGYDAIGDQTTL